MPDNPPIPGTIRSILCPLCTERNKTPMRRQHQYGETRAGGHLERFWECINCGHRIPLGSETVG
jgi:Zn ribbon nucleic-acid-binding protein